MAVHPDTGQFFYFKNGAFREYVPLVHQIDGINNITDLMEGAKEMETNYIVHATQENLPVYSLH